MGVRRHHPAAQIAALRRFDVVRFAQKANSNTHILRLMRAQGVQVDAVSLGEIDAPWRPVTSRGCITGTPRLFYCRCAGPCHTLARVVELGVPVNCGSIDMLRQLGAASLVIRCGCASTPALAMGTATRPTPVASTASTALAWRAGCRPGRGARTGPSAAGLAHAHWLGRGLQSSAGRVWRHGGPGAPGAGGGHGPACDFGRAGPVDSLPCRGAGDRYRSLLLAVGCARQTITSEAWATRSRWSWSRAATWWLKSGVLVAEVRAVKSAGQPALRAGGCRFHRPDAPGHVRRPPQHGIHPAPTAACKGAPAHRGSGPLCESVTYLRKARAV